MSQRLAYFFCALTVAVILSTGVYLEYVEGIIPCPLCTLQRICFGICGLYFLFGLVLYRMRIARLIVNFLTVIMASLGALLAGRQIWIQFFPSPESSECGVSIKYLLSVLPVKEVAQKILSGGTECSQRGWEFLKLDIPEWSLIFFVFFILISLYYLVKDCKANS